jgi:RNA polymerase sigma factor (sigma-70 family)
MLVYTDHIEDFGGEDPPKKKPKRNALWKRLDDMPLLDIHKQIIVYRFLDGLSFRQIAEKIGLSAERAHSLCKEALKRVQEALGGKV